MTRYQKVKQILDAMRPEDRRICQVKGGCACRGCASSKGVKEHELKLYEQGKLK
jgi:hypothetical protein